LNALNSSRSFRVSSRASRSSFCAARRRLSHQRLAFASEAAAPQPNGERAFVERNSPCALRSSRSAFDAARSAAAARSVAAAAAAAAATAGHGVRQCLGVSGKQWSQVAYRAAC